MDLERAEQRFHVLQAQYKAGGLDEDTYRLEVAKLLLRDHDDAFWMVDADTGTWFCNRSGDWEPGDPHTQFAFPDDSQAARRAGRRRLGRLAALGVTLLLLLGLAAGAILWLAPVEISWNPFQPTPVPDLQVEITIASPADGSQVALGQAVAIESTIDALPNLGAVDRVTLQVDGQTVATQPIQPQIEPGQRSFPLSQPWRPDGAGEYRVEVAAFSVRDEPLGTAAITLYATEAPEEAPQEPACIPDSIFVADVTMPPGTAFPPGARMDKVWQVRNSGSCAWGIGYQLIPLEEAGLGAPASVPVPPAAAGELVDLAVTLWAPVEPGAYSSSWQLRSPDGAIFGATLPLTFHVEALAIEGLPPVEPAQLEAAVTEDGQAVRLTWLDLSDNEDAYRIYRADVRDSIGLAPADSQLFVDSEVACGNRYRYWIEAFNAAGTSATSAIAEVVLPPCAPRDDPPILSLSVVPTQVLATRPFTVAFEADDDLGLQLVVVWGMETEEPMLDAGRVFTCTEVVCTGAWPITWTREASVTLTLLGVALDSSGQESAPAWMTVDIRPLE